MPKKRKFIDKKKAVTFHLLYRSQHDPLAADENAPQRVLFPTSNDKSTKEKVKEEERKYGIYFDDDYNYLQHLRNTNKTNVEWIEAPHQSKSEKPHVNLPSSLFASAVEEDVGLLNKAAPQSGLRLDLDPDVVAAMDEDFDYSNPNNMLEDNFIELANGCPGLENSGEESNEDSNSEYDSELDDEIRSLNDFETKSRFTDYSMSSSIISRNSQLTMLDETFEQMFANYDDVEIGALECDEIEGELDVDCPMFKQAAEEFEKERQQESLTAEDVSKLCINSSDESDVENDYLVEVKEKEKWDCESILSTYSNIYNHPKLIKEPINRIRINKKTGMPMEKSKLTKQALSQLDNLNNREEQSFFTDETMSEGENTKKYLETKKIGKETLQEKKLRKRQVKELRKERRMERKSNAAAFKEEKKKLEKTMVHNKLNRQGIAIK